MMGRVRVIWIAIAPLALAGCEKADNAPGPGGVTMGEARALDDAAKMIDARRPPPGLSQPSQVQWPPDGPTSGTTDPTPSPSVTAPGSTTSSQG
jgi:hypothetical protein